MPDRPRRTNRRLGGAAVALLALVGLVVMVAASASASGSGSGRGSHLLVGHGRSDEPIPPVPGTAPAGPGTGSVGAASRSFSIAGTVAGLYPGGARLLVLTVINPQRYAITVASISITAGSASSSCPAADVSVSAFAGHLPVGAGRTASTTVTMTMRHSAPDSCQAAVFPLNYRGLAVRS